jgi:hypothetical protein
LLNVVMTSSAAGLLAVLVLMNLAIPLEASRFHF